MQIDLQSDNLVFVDLETTGSRYNRDRIIEVYASKMRDGEIVEEFSSLVNPGFRPDRFILDLTGINYSELKDSPKFEEIYKLLFEFLEGEIIVAHNARFDYSFLKSEFAKQQIAYKSHYICTIKLSRMLYPEYPKHNLSEIIKRFDIRIDNRHRAKGDVHAMKTFFYRAQEDHSTEFNSAIEKVIKKESIPKHLINFDFKEIPNNPGVYFFRGDDTQPLYIGKSIKLRNRIKSHMYADTTNSKDFRINTQIKKIDFEETAGELGALLRESYYIKKLSPLHNRKLRQNLSLVKLKRGKTEEGYFKLSVDRDGQIDIEEIENIYGIFGSKKYTKIMLQGKGNKYRLCAKLLDLEKGKGACFGYHLGICSGACVGEIEPKEYNKIFEKAFKENKIDNWPFRSAIKITEKSNFIKENLYFYKWLFLGSEIISGRENNHKNLTIENPEVNNMSRLFNHDTYKILNPFLKNKNLKIEEVNLEEINVDKLKTFQ